MKIYFLNFWKITLNTVKEHSKIAKLNKDVKTMFIVSNSIIENPSVQFSPEYLINHKLGLDLDQVP